MDTQICILTKWMDFFLNFIIFLAVIRGLQIHSFFRIKLNCITRLVNHRQTDITWYTILNTTTSDFVKIIIWNKDAHLDT